MRTLRIANTKLPSCKTPFGPTGAGHARITFARSGAVSDVVLDQGAFVATDAVGECAIRLLRAVRIPRVERGPSTVGFAFVVD